MQVQATFYGELAQATGTNTTLINDINTVHGIYRYLEETFPSLARKSFRILVNDEVINQERELEDGDEVLLVAPHVS